MPKLGLLLVALGTGACAVTEGSPPPPPPQADFEAALTCVSECGGPRALTTGQCPEGTFPESACPPAEPSFELLSDTEPCGTNPSVTALDFLSLLQPRYDTTLSMPRLLGQDEIPVTVSLDLTGADRICVPERLGGALDELSVIQPATVVLETRIHIRAAGDLLFVTFRARINPDQSGARFRQTISVEDVLAARNEASSNFPWVLNGKGAAQELHVDGILEGKHTTGTLRERRNADGVLIEVGTWK